MTPAVHKEIAGVLWLVVVGFGVFGVWFFIQKGEAGLVVILIIFFQSLQGHPTSHMLQKHQIL